MKSTLLPVAGSGNSSETGLFPMDSLTNAPSKKSVLKKSPGGGFAQCHFFAGVGGWPLALRIAGVADDEPVWTGSCPCQPFSDSGAKVGFRDPRHLFPTWRRLIARCGPAVVFGEQVPSKLGLEWLARVRLEMASLGYATRGGDFCSAGVSAPNRRQRLYFVADTDGNRLSWRQPKDDGRPALSPSAPLPAGGVGDTNDSGRQRRGLRFVRDAQQRTPWETGAVGLLCADGKTRRIKPEIFPLAARLPGDLGLIRGAGNAINPWVAAKFIRDAFQ